MKKLLFSLLFVAACSSGFDGAVDARDVGRVQAVESGVVIRKNPIKIRGNVDPTTGTMVGAGLGALGGSLFGGSTEGHLLGAVVGGTAGGLAGHAIGKNAGTSDGYEYDVRMDISNRIFSIIQGRTPELYVGQRVLVKSSGGRAYITPK